MNNFCHNCGTKNESESKFCSNCGEQLEIEITSKETSFSKDGSDEDISVGIIFTNIKALSKKLNIDKKQISTLLEQYTSALRKVSVHYSVIDSSNYNYLNPETKDRCRNVSLTSNDGYLEHSHLLADYYKYGICKEEESPSYLFIIGGDDIIPMPFLSREDMELEDVDSDLPYSYLLSEKTFCISENMDEMFSYTPFFQVGRLPIGEDSTFEDLRSYLSRAVSVSLTGVELAKAFGQSDIHWREVSHMVTDSISDILPQYTGENNEYYSYEGIATTPAIVSGREDVEGGIEVAQILDPSVNLLYFNLHGSGAPKSGDFVGEIPNGSRNYLSAICPEHLAALCENNIVVTEACYGSKFMIRSSSSKSSNIEKDYSMILSALSNKTLLFLGSSRVAFGAPRAHYMEENPDGFCADIICKVFMSSMCDYYRAGDALFLARQAILTDKYRHNTDPAQNIATIFEFNLFGDPTIFAQKYQREKTTSFSKSAKRVTLNGNISPLVSKADINSYKKTELFSTKKTSILQQVRSLVDANVAQIRETLNQYLYSNFGIEGRDLKRITKIEYPSKKTFYSFTYKKEAGEWDETLIVTSDKDGTIKSIITSK